MKDIDRITEFLHSGHHGSPDADIPSSAEPIPESMIRLNLDQLTLYDRNPRIQPNQDYTKLKASLLKTGAAKVLLAVTRRPGDTLYFPAAGGNTRLTALKELWDESNDEQFYWINCKFIAYTDEMQLMVAHLSENDNRSDYLFIDRARAICELHEELSRTEGESVTQRAFIEHLLLMGYPKLNRTYLDLFRYTVNHLYPYIPSALDAGMGPRKVQDLRRLQKDLNVFFGPEGIGSMEVQQRSETLFPAVLSELDRPNGDGIDQQMLVTSMLGIMAPIIMALMEQGESQFAEAEIILRMKHAWTSFRNNPDHPIHSIYSSNREDSGVEPERDFGAIEPAVNAKPAQTPNAHENHAPDPPQASSLSTGSQGCWSRYRNLTEDIFSQVSKYATEFNFADLVSPFLLEKPVGNGFWVDLPESNRNLNDHAVAAWWWLWDISGLTTEPGAIAELIIHDRQFAQSRIAGQFRTIAEAATTASQSEIESTLVPYIESSIPKRIHPVQFLRSMSDLQYSLLASVIEMVRGVDTIIEKIDSNDS